MKIYIAYKYRNNKDKENLITNLEKLASNIDNMGYEAFLLGRDVKKWEYMHLGFIGLIPVIFKNVKNSDIVVGYINSKSFSKGLLFELFLAKILGKKSVCFDVDNCDLTYYKTFFTKIINISRPDDVKKEDFNF